MKCTDQSHPDPDELERFICEELERLEVRVVVRHLLTGCPQCVAVTSQFLIREWKTASARNSAEVHHEVR